MPEAMEHLSLCGRWRGMFDGQWPPYLAARGDAVPLADQICLVLNESGKATAWVEALQPSLHQRFSGKAVARGYGDILDLLLQGAAARTKNTATP